MSYVLIITQDQTSTNLNTDARLITAKDWNSLPTKEKVEIIVLAVSITQVQDATPPNTNEELLKIINSGTPIIDANETLY